MTILVIRGAILPGADEGVQYYTGRINVTKFADFELWRDAVNLLPIYKKRNFTE